MSLFQCKIPGSDESLVWTDIAGTTQSVPTKLVILFDVSASMGRYIRVIWQRLKTLIEEYRLQDVTIITFGVQSTLTNWDWKTIKRWNCPSQENSTLMVSAAQSAFNMARVGCLTQYMVISDGQVHDLNQVTNWGGGYANREWLLRLVQNRETLPGTVQAAGMRISAEGDTQAVSCFFKFHNHPGQKPVLLDSAYSDSDIEVGLIQMFDTFKMGVNLSQIVVKGQVAADCASSFVDVMSVGQNQIFIVRGDTKNVQINGKVLPIVERMKLPEPMVLAYLMEIERRIRTLKVLGAAVDIKRVNLFVNALGDLVQMDQEDMAGFRGQVRAIMRRAQSHYKTVITQIQQLLNLNNVDRLNAQQQAEFLRAVDSSTASGRRLAKRHAEADDPEMILRTALGKLISVFRSDRNQLGGQTSFFSLTSTGEILADALDEFGKNPEAFQNMGLTDLLRCIGAVGIAFTANTGDYPDPWSFRVKQVWFGKYLSQPDLLNSFDSGTPIAPPGYPENAITGVDPLAFPEDIGTVKLYCMSGINRFHASICMRRLVAIIPMDAVALKTAVIMRMEDLAAQDPTELKVSDTLTNIKTHQMLVHDDIFSPEFKEDPYDPTKWHADMGISNVLKVFCWTIGAKLDRERMLELFRNMYRLDLYYLVRSKFQTLAADERIPVVQTLLGIDLAKGPRPTPPGELEPSDLVFPNDFDEDASYDRLQQWLASDIADRWSRLLHWALSDGLLQKLKEPHPILDTKLGFIKSCIGALITRETTDYLALMKSDAFAYPRMVVEAAYRTEYNQKLKQKRAIEEARRLELAIDRLTWSYDIDEFIKILQVEIPNNDGYEYKQLVKSLEEQVQVPLLEDKVWVLVFGRSPDFNPDEYINGFDVNRRAIVWNNGNLCSRNERNRLCKILSDANISTVRLMDIVRRLGYVAHVYRESDIPNRHGHCNSNPYIPEE